MSEHRPIVESAADGQANSETNGHSEVDGFLNGDSPTNGHYKAHLRPNTYKPRPLVAPIYMSTTYMVDDVFNDAVSL